MAKTIVPIGPYHPLQEEPEFFKLTVEGERVVAIDVHVGYNHRGIEKISEMKTFDQSVYTVERICGICSTSHPFACVQAVEDIILMEVPDRAKYIRTIIAEGERIHSHLLWLGLAGHFLGYNTVFMWAWKLREEILDVMEILSGNRNNYAMFTPGGVRRDIKAEDIPVVLKKVDSILPTLDMLKKAVMDDPVLHARTKGVGILTRDEAISFSALGPTARASGVAKDVRKDAPYAAYDQVDWKMIVTQNGDVFDKLAIRVLETFESVKIMKYCLTHLPGGEIKERIKNIPPGEGIGTHEAPRGEVFHYVRSDGTNRPVRHKIRAPTYMNLPTYKATIIGETISDATIILAAIDPCYCCTERLAVRDMKGKKLFNGEDLVRLSQEKTMQLKKKMGF
ncbi:MAG: NADH:ubiquinone oxidoreductase [Omnitrophica bacterium RIFCSPLOWO2_12_FULL_44_17]|uniref:NADH:ubiquinone oxidoreductase n=1 Tax=Candidatus Danuiimicrobium aquiferis TaxID=1801832 RepID=A0A1G1L2X8_9BACT|nr:MAG: NADH:ubiquinone oxidoreductase [Omnitrophica bacterium RIFCSPHIGHO2_02_FULL_45_28]OGW89676.1 MAG: NADH:ubiquinone oxidoreductase [Omnitrophica bacterium RIFCSPHIGHO2_12_FULL_44_12]OGW99486.1 MAG: NADH:ubiquinone oxidoreductase [Omnitrophica bacterium RIFCSPLOWO2_12_FULL_44_17]OGX04322.1 MAG: NADH:ubiquinone oxidoreductase [Omnitrophica bacterium RIFCSPLOWO2_02_FULL_44_11]